jgi:hypothetical protein
MLDEGIDVAMSREMLNGFAKGAMDTENMQAVEVCFDDVENLVGRLVKAVKDIKAGGVPEYIAALDEIEDAIKFVRFKGLGQCYASLGGWLQLVEWAEMFAHPSELIIDVEKDFKLNGVQIMEELT